MATLSDQQIAALEPRMRADPEIQRLWQYLNEQVKQGHGRGPDTFRTQAQLLQIAKTKYGLPEDYSFNANTGKISRAGFLSRNPWIIPAAMGGIAAPFMAVGGAASGGAAAVPEIAGSGAAVGATGSTVPVIGGLVPGLASGSNAALNAASAGGGVPSILDLFRTGADIAGAYGSGRQDQRDQANNDNWRYDQQKVAAARLLEEALGSRAGYGLDRDRLKLAGAQFGETSLMNRGDLDLRQRQFGLDAPRARARNAVTGDTLASNVDASISGLPPGVTVPQISGGLRPSMRSTDTMALGKDMSRSALMAQLQGDTFDKLPDLKVPDVQDYQFPAPNIPEITPPQQPGALDTGLNLAGLGADAASLYDYYRRQRQGKA